MAFAFFLKFRLLHAPFLPSAFMRINIFNYFNMSIY